MVLVEPMSSTFPPINARDRSLPCLDYLIAEKP
jgi:hypothetical protein